MIYTYLPAEKLSIARPTEYLWNLAPTDIVRVTEGEPLTTLTVTAWDAGVQVQIFSIEIRLRRKKKLFSTVNCYTVKTKQYH